MKNYFSTLVQFIKKSKYHHEWIQTGANIILVLSAMYTTHLSAYSSNESRGDYADRKKSEERQIRLVEATIQNMIRQTHSLYVIEEANWRFRVC